MQHEKVLKVHKLFFMLVPFFLYNERAFFINNIYVYIITIFHSLGSKKI